jgi:hypothetical protein
MRVAWFILVGFCAYSLAPLRGAQPLAPQNDQIKLEETGLYADARPYIDEPLPKLKKIVHELKGAEAGRSHEPLPNLLAKIGAKADELLQSLPDLISDEGITQNEFTESDAAGCTGLGCASGDKAKRSEGKFNYINVRHLEKDQRGRLEEYRSGHDGKPASEGASGRFQGFIMTWITFSSANQQESRFCDLGEQRMDGHNTFVVGFAQIPGSVENPGRIVTPSAETPMLLQGIAWVDQADFRIVRLRTDLLAPQPQAGMQRQVANIGFGPVHIAAENNLELWLPHAVDIEMEGSGREFFEEHKYSNYRLFQVKAKILAPAN